MPFEFDDKKSISNKAKHGIDFIEAQKLWNDPERIEIPARNLDEPRFMIIGRIGMDIWSGIFTIRNKNIRIISVRKARENEKEIYEGF
ncbi:MAG: BrnT family toxin [Bacteroidales bacterium]|nr:BrnT family toxin [Bacteroidales bacterium]